MSEYSKINVNYSNVSVFILTVLLWTQNNSYLFLDVKREKIIKPVFLRCALRFLIQGWLVNCSLYNISLFTTISPPQFCHLVTKVWSITLSFELSAIFTRLLLNYWLVSVWVNECDLVWLLCVVQRVQCTSTQALVRQTAVILLLFSHLNIKFHNQMSVLIYCLNITLQVCIIDYFLCIACVVFTLCRWHSCPMNCNKEALVAKMLFMHNYN